jgi:hypothetical protein
LLDRIAGCPMPEGMTLSAAISFKLRRIETAIITPKTEMAAADGRRLIV